MCSSFRYTPKVAKAFGLEEKDIHPSDKCLVLTRNQKKMVPFGYKTNSLILNARQETLLEKPLFKVNIINNCQKKNKISLVLNLIDIYILDY